MEIKFINTTHNYEGVSKSDIVAAIEDINLSISDKDEFIAIVGKTGSGKSTLVEHINGLLLPTKGSVDVLGSVLTPKKRKNPRLMPIRKKVGFVFQFPEYQLFEETVIKDIEFAPKNFGFKSTEARQKALEAAKLVGLDQSLLEKSPFNLSGGQMRKVAIAGILSYNPDVLVLDEPTRGLDPEGANEIMDLFDRINKKMHKTIILISHSMDNVYKYATRVVVMDKSHVVYDGDKYTLFKDNIYEKYHLEKPDVLKAVDYLNKELNLNIDYDVYDLPSLITKLKEVYHE